MLIFGQIRADSGKKEIDKTPVNIGGNDCG
jgi:hypothetical protein